MVGGLWGLPGGRPSSGRREGRGCGWFSEALEPLCGNVPLKEPARSCDDGTAQRRLLFFFFFPEENSTGICPRLGRVKTPDAELGWEVHTQQRKPTRGSCVCPSSLENSSVWPAGGGIPNGKRVAYFCGGSSQQASEQQHVWRKNGPGRGRRVALAGCRHAGSLGVRWWLFLAPPSRRG